MKLKTNTPEDPQVVLRALFENQSAYDCGHELPHRVLGVQMGGGFCCTVVAGLFHALQDAGLTNCFTLLIPVSGSAGVAAGYLSGLAHRAGKVFEHLATSGFMVPTYAGVRLNQMRLRHALDGTDLPLAIDVERVRTHTTGLRIVASTVRGERRFIDVRGTKNLFDAIVASGAMPGTCAPIAVDGELLVDGICGGDPMPIEDGLAYLTPGAHERPKVLVFQSRIHPKYRLHEWWWPYFAHGYYFWEHRTLRHNLAHIDLCFADKAEVMSAMRDVDCCRVALTLDDVALTPITSDVGQLARATNDARRFFAEALARARVRREV